MNALTRPVRSAPALAAIALAIAVASPPAAAALYKWVDANGRVVYSDQPPLNAKSELVGAAAPPANPDAVKEMANKEAELKKRQADRAEAATKNDKSRSEAQKLAAMCSQARNQAAGLRRLDVAMYRLNDKGDRVMMDDATRKAEAQRLDALIKEHKCPAV